MSIINNNSFGIARLAFHLVGFNNVAYNDKATFGGKSYATHHIDNSELVHQIKHSEASFTEFSSIFKKEPRPLETGAKNNNKPTRLSTALR